MQAETRTRRRRSRRRAAERDDARALRSLLGRWEALLVGLIVVVTFVGRAEPVARSS